MDAALTPYRVLRNLVDYPLRRKLKVRRPVRDVKPAGLDYALDVLQEEDQREARRLISSYGLEALAQRGTRRDILENLFYLDMIVTALAGANVQLPVGKLTAVDAGVGHWFYVQALYAALRQWRASRAREVELLGFELDPYRVYDDGHSRADWADWYLRAVPEAIYVPEDARRWKPQPHVAFMLFPFVFATDADKWGLPRTVFQPVELLQHVWRGLRPGGALIVSNQGRDEADEQKRLFAKAGVPPTWGTRFASPFFRYKEPRYIYVAVKGATNESSRPVPAPRADGRRGDPPRRPGTR
jgi:SAM-dependent methyltransferase